MSERDRVQYQRHALCGKTSLQDAHMERVLGSDVVMSHVKVNPKNWSYIRKVREACRLLRSTGAEWIRARRTAMRNGDVPKDILTQIMKAASKGGTNAPMFYRLDDENSNYPHFKQRSNEYLSIELEFVF